MRPEMKFDIALQKSMVCSISQNAVNLLRCLVRRSGCFSTTTPWSLHTLTGRRDLTFSNLLGVFTWSFQWRRKWGGQAGLATQPGSLKCQHFLKVNFQFFQGVTSTITGIEDNALDTPSTTPVTPYICFKSCLSYPPPNPRS